MESSGRFSLFTHIFLILIVFVSSQPANADTGIDLLNSLNQAMGRLTKVSDQIQDLNDDDSMLEGYFQTMQLDPNADSLKAAGDNIVYPQDLKTEYDTATNGVFSAADEVFAYIENGDSDPACKDRMAQIKVKMDAAKPTITATQGLSVGSPKPRAEAYLSIMQSLPLALVTAEISMAKMSVCM